MSKDNLALYNSVRSVPPEAQKQFSSGTFKGTDINPMWRIKTLTDQFGMCGVGWYFDVLSERSERINDDTVVSVVDINLYIRVDGEWSKPIFGTGGNTIMKRVGGKDGRDSRITVSDEGYKMALTDALSVACKHLGIGADVYFASDKTKYTANNRDSEKADEKPAELTCERCNKPVTGITVRGNALTPAQIVERSMSAFGGCYCYQCSLALKKAREQAGK